MRTRPLEALDSLDAALVVAAARQSRPTVRSLAVAVGRSVEVTHRRLTRLRALGAVSWTSGKDGTMRGMDVVAANPRDYPSQV